MRGTDDAAGIGCVNEDVPADHGVVGRVGSVAADVGVREVDAIEPLFACARGGKRKRRFVDVDAGHAAAAADQAGGDHRQLADAAADIEHAHARGQAGAA